MIWRVLGNAAIMAVLAGVAYQWWIAGQYRAVIVAGVVFALTAVAARIIVLLERLAGEGEVAP